MIKIVKSNNIFDLKLFVFVVIFLKLKFVV